MICLSSPDRFTSREKRWHRTDYTWDNANRLTGIAQGSQTVGFSYDNTNRRTQLILPNGVTVAYTYDQDSCVSGMTYSAGGTQLGNLTYAYDADGRRTAMGGSLAAVSLPSAVSGNAFNAANAMTLFNGATLSYDADSNLTSDGANTYTWNARNHLSAISGGSTASFVYDALGRRIEKTINGVTTEFLYDGLNPMQELNGATPPIPTANLLTGLNVDEYFTRTDSSGTMALLSDALGSTIGVVNSGGSIDTSYAYEPFGNTTVSGSNANPYQFTGRENDGTGLYYYRARYYSPTFQRFVSQDGIDFAGGINLFAYAVNNPIRLRDPFGTCEQPGQPPSPCSTLGGAGYAAVVTATDFLLGGLAGFETGGLIGTGIGIAIGPPAVTVTAPIGSAIGTIVGMDIGIYKAIGDVFDFCNWGPAPWPFGLVPIDF